jgi:hypothetical protein
VPYDADLLAQARQYGSIGVEAALWSLGMASIEWAEAVEMSDAAGAMLVHPERGRLAVSDVMRTNAHDAHHHAWDISRILSAPVAP